MADVTRMVDQNQTRIDPMNHPRLMRGEMQTLPTQEAANDGHFLKEALKHEDLPTLPRVFRIVALERQLIANTYYETTVVVFHEEASLRVVWTARHPNVQLKVGKLVEIRWLGGNPKCVGGAIEIARLVLIDQPRRKTDIFKTIPSSWVKDRNLTKRASFLWSKMNDACQELVTAIFWEAERFGRFCAGPSSCIGHHREWGGNFRHAVETAEAAMALLPQFPTANASLAIAVALLHDAGKSEDYVYEEGYGNRLSDWGRLVSHRPTLTLWIGEVHRFLKPRLSDEMLQSLLHAVTAIKGPPSLGLRDPMTPEAILLSLADNASGKGDLMAKVAANEGGWGTVHPHLNGKGTYTVGANSGS